LNSLKEYVENKERKKMRLKNEINVT